MTCEGQIFSAVKWSLLSESVGELRARVAAVESAEALDPATTREILRETSRAFVELLALLEPFVREVEQHPHIGDTHRAPVGA